MISEQDAWNATPPAGWVHDYMAHAEKQTTAPMGYHLACALSLLSVTTPTAFGHRYAGNLYGNLYTLLVGRSGEDRKSSALGVAKEILYSADPSLIGRMPGSPEGLVDSLAEQPRQILRYSEFGSFLAKAQSKGGYFAPMKALLTDLWDCTPQSRAKANGTGTNVPDPRLSIMAACSTPYLEKYTNPEDWSGGFMGRWAVIYTQRVRVEPDPRGDPSAIPALAKALRDRANVAAVGPCLGLNPEASALWRDWFFHLEARKVDANIAGAKTRAPTIARKAAMLYAWDFGEAFTEDPWYITPEHLKWGVRFAELHLRSVLGIAEKLAEHPDARLRRTVMEIVPLGEARSMADILRLTKMRKRVITEILEGLVMDGSFKPHVVNGQVGSIFYERLR